MAAATVLAPSSHYLPPPPPSFAASTYPSHSPASSPPSRFNMNPSEPRRMPDDNEAPPPARQTLPSLSQVLSAASQGSLPPPPPPPPHSNMAPQPSAGGLPSPYAPPSRQYSDPDRHSHSPQTLHPPHSFPSPRPPYGDRHGLGPVTDRRPTPPGQPDGSAHHVPVPLHPDHRSVSASYPQPAAPTSHPFQPSHLPPGQLPLPSYPPSPRHEHFEASSRPQTHGESAPPYGRRYDNPRHFENWTCHESFGRIGAHARTVFNFAETYSRFVEEPSSGSPERLPSEREVNEMLANVDYIKRSLEQVREIVQLTARAREGAKNSAYEGNHDVGMYSDGMKPQYPVNEVKKRRGRAAPPGRCHSCNRIDTPEWRRGPDGARTLCNACGLHYAKLERKRLTEARSLRPKTEERN